MQDRLINGKLIHDVDPEELLRDLNNHGFECIIKVFISCGICTLVLLDRGQYNVC